MLLTYLTHGFQLAVAQPESPQLRGAIMHKAFGEMYNLKAIAEILVRLPMRPGSKERAGPPFEIPERAALELPPDKRAAYWQSHRANLDAARTLRQQLAAQGLPGGSNDDRYLKTLCSLDEQTTEWVDSIVKGFKTAGG
jgi:hypothetical protein